jgi:hypothetical protein
VLRNSLPESELAKHFSWAERWKESYPAQGLLLSFLTEQIRHATELSSVFGLESEP